MLRGIGSKIGATFAFALMSAAADVGLLWREHQAGRIRFASETGEA
jgi:hypothetical protein